MVIKFAYPFVLLLLPLIWVGLWYTAGMLRKMPLLKRRIILALRGMITMLLVLSLAGTQLVLTADHTATIFLLDGSDSMNVQRSRAEAFVREAMEQKPKQDEVGVIAFGKNAVTEVFLGKDATFSQCQSDIDGRYTNLAQALSNGLAGLPDDARKRIVLLTDGQDNIGNVKEITPLLEGTQLLIYPFREESRTEVALNSIRVPQKASISQQFTIQIQIDSTIDTDAKLALFDGEQRIAYEAVTLTKGENNFVFRDTADHSGFRTYRAVIEPSLDTLPVNNEAATFIDIQDQPRILLAEDFQGEADEMEKILQASSIAYDKLEATNLPSTLEGLASYQAIVLTNVSAEHLPAGFLSNLGSYVSDLGGGLLVTGGENSYALGGYFKTPLEKTLPVNMEMKGKKQIPDMSIVLVIDKSGSMTDGSGGITKLDLAKEAAVRSLDSLRAQDSIGVIAFDDTVYWPVKLQKSGGNEEKIKDDIGTIRAGGGTSILPALTAAYEKIKDNPTKIKHMILLTDGQAESTGYDKILADCKTNHITVSTVAVGNDADGTLLEQIAKGAGGRYYATNNISAIPSIFAKETFMASRAYINNRVFVPVIASPSAILSGIGNQLPPLKGYIGTSEKATAKVLLQSDEGDPILAVWQKGLGRAVAWTSDMNGRWSGNYTGWEGNLKLWQNVLSYAVKGSNDHGIALETTMDGSQCTVTMRSEDTSDTTAKAIFTSPSGKRQELELYATAPGTFEASLDLEEKGVYMLSAVQSKDKVVLGSALTGVAVNYSPEYRISERKDTLDRLIAAGAITVETPEEVYQKDPPRQQGSKKLTSLLLILALLLFMVDIAMRRLNLPLHRLEAMLATGKTKWRNVTKQKRNWNVVKKESALDPPAVLDKESENMSFKNKSSTEIKTADDQEKIKKQDKTQPKQALDTSALLKRKKNHK